MRVLFIGDIFGRPGRMIVKALVPHLRQKYELDLTIANCENMAGGLGATSDLLREILNDGVDAITMGNHVWKKRELLDQIDSLDRVVRPANFAEGVPGKRRLMVPLAGGTKVGVINLVGRIFMDQADCPFRAALREVETLSHDTNNIIVDMHAEATSEKIAMGWFLDGKVSAVIGTHTHVQSADERILPGGCAYITDVGMTGPHDSVIGIKTEPVLKRFVDGLPVKFEVADENILLKGVVFEVNESTGKAVDIFRIVEKQPPRQKGHQSG